MTSLSNRSVLVVEDDASMLRALDKVLRGEGAAVTCAMEAAEAVEILTKREETFDVVITDLRMPLMTGMTLINAIQEDSPALPVIVLTAFGSPYLKAECLKQGAAAFLEKPLNTPQLLEAIQSALTSPRATVA